MVGGLPVAIVEEVVRLAMGVVVDKLLVIDAAVEELIRGYN